MSDDIFARRAIVNRELKKLEKLISEVETRAGHLERKSRGTTRANREAAKLAREVEDLKSRFVAAGPTPAVMLGVEDLSAKVEAVLAETQRLDMALKNTYLEVAEHGDKLRDHEGRLDAIEGSEAMSISFADSKIDVAHQGEIDNYTPWAEAAMWGLVGGLVGFFAFVVMMNVENGWIAALACYGIAFFTAAHLLQRHQLKLAIQARHEWAYKEKPAEAEKPAETESKEDPRTEVWINPLDEVPAGSATGGELE